MSRITGSEVASLMEAYSSVYAPQELTEEQIWEEVENWVNSLLEEGYDLSEYTWEEMYEEYMSEGGPGPRVGTTPSTPSRPYMGPLSAGGGRAAIDKLTSKGVDPRKANAMVVAQGEKNLRAKPAAPAARPPAAAAPAARPPAPAAPAARPAAAPAAPKVAPTKPASAQTGDKAKDMDTWAKANPKLAAAAAERARTRGTSQSDNPLMKGMPGKRPMTPSVQSPTLAKDLGKGSGNQSLLNNPNASKAATPSPAAKVTPAATPARSGFGVSSAPIAAKASVANVTAPEVKATNTIAATPKLPSVAPKAPTGGPRTRAQVLGQSFDPFDVIKGHLLDEGYADTEEAALVIMANMSEEWRQSILEG